MEQTENISEISEEQKENLLQEALKLLEDKVLKLTLDNPASQSTNKNALRENLAFLIEAICTDNPADGIDTCKQFFKDVLVQLDTNPDELDNNQLLSKVIFFIKQKLNPLYLNYIKSNNAPAHYVNFIEEASRQDEKKQKTGRIIGFLGIPQDYLPPWFNAIEARRRRQEMLEKAVTDPETEALRQDIHKQVQADLKGE